MYGSQFTVPVVGVDEIPAEPRSCGRRTNDESVIRLSGAASLGGSLYLPIREVCGSQQFLGDFTVCEISHSNGPIRNHNERITL